MISFDLSCHYKHIFEAWFRSSADYDAQIVRGLVACPTCGDTVIAKAAMAPNVAGKGNRAVSAETTTRPMTNAAPTLPPEIAEMLGRIAQAQAEALPKSRWVGRRFAEEVRAVHSASEDGDAPTPAIHGQATAAEAEALAEEGIAIMPLLVPFTPPELLN